MQAARAAFPSFSRHRYDQVQRLPERFLVAGDAVCSFDPRFGQGMTVAIIEAAELGRALDAGGVDGVGARTLAAARWAAGAGRCGGRCWWTPMPQRKILP